MNSAANFALYVTVALLICHFTGGFPFSGHLVAPEPSLMEKTLERGVMEASLLESPQEAHSIVPRMVQGSFYKNKNEDEIELAEEIYGRKSASIKRQAMDYEPDVKRASVIKRQDPEKNDDDEDEEIKPADKGNKTMTDFGRRLKLG